MDKVPNGANMIGEFFRERQRLSDEPGNRLSEGAIKAFDMIGFPGFFTYSAMALGGNYGFVRRPKIGITDRALPINGWQRRPEGLSAFPAAIPDMDPDDLAGIAVDRQPNPLFIIAVLNERPQFVTLDGQPSTALFFTWTWRGVRSYFWLTWVCNQRSETPVIRAMPAKEIRSRSSLSIKLLV